MRPVEELQSIKPEQPRSRGNSNNGTDTADAGRTLNHKELHKVESCHSGWTSRKPKIVFRPVRWPPASCYRSLIAPLRAPSLLPTPAIPSAITLPSAMTISTTKTTTAPITSAITSCSSSSSPHSSLAMSDSASLPLPVALSSAPRRHQVRCSHSQLQAWLYESGWCENAEQWQWLDTQLAREKAARTAKLRRFSFPSSSSTSFSSTNTSSASAEHTTATFSSSSSFPSARKAESYIEVSSEEEEDEHSEGEIIM